MRGPPRNPFRPTTGATPPELIGRQGLLDEIVGSLEDGPGSPGRIGLFSGQRGVGKTVMLNEAAAVAQNLGWHTVELTATPGLLTRLDMALTRLLEAEAPPPRRRVTGVQVAGVGGMSFEPVAALASDLRAKLTELLDILQPRESGVMLTVDEVHSAARAELRELSAMTQHMVREDREFALMMAGLPSAISGLLSDDVLTFLRRADQYTLGALDVHDVRDAYEKTFEEAGRSLDPSLSAKAAAASDGYPFLVQLIGFHIWRRSAGSAVDAAAVERGINDARARLGSVVHAPALKDLSEVDRRFLVAMAEDDDRSLVADIGRRLAKDRNYVNYYRRRLLDAQVVEEAGRGYVRFAIPYLRDYLRELSGPS